MIPSGKHGMFVTISNKAMNLMQHGYSFPIEMVGKDGKLKFIFLSESTFSANAKKFAAQIALRQEVDKQTKELGESLNNEKDKESIKQSDSDKSVSDI